MTKTHSLYANTAYPPIARPWEVGIPEEAICEFIDRLEKTNVPMHALLLMRHGKLVTEGYYAPFEKNTLHRMFSICKTLTALAIGLLEADGKLSLEDKIVDYFPDKVPENVHPYIKDMTIKNMLMMRTCHVSTTYKYDWNFEWVESFFTVAPTHKPGTIFHYDTSASHVLCALVKRLTGQDMIDFLKDRCLRKIGWSEESYVLQNQFGDLQGGSGLMCTPMDLLLLGQLLLNHGEWNGEQLLPRKYVETATSKLSPTFMTGPVASEMQGYGYQIWHGEKNNFVLYGMGGQLVICMPDYDLVCVTCADTQGIGGGNQYIYNCFYETILPAMDMMSMGTYPMTLQEGGYTAYDRLKDKLNVLHIKSICEETSTCVPSSTCQHKINDVEYAFAENPEGFTHMKLSFDPSSDVGTLSYSYQGNTCKLTFGLKECINTTFPIYNMNCSTSGAWLAPNLFHIRCYILDTSVGSVRFELSFGENDLVVHMRKIEETMFNEYNGHLYGIQA